jgi:hypothetical protein
MRTKRFSALMLSAMMALTAIAFTGSAVSADYDKHPNIVIQAAIRLDNIDTAAGPYQRANNAVKLLKEIRHWVREHPTPAFVKRTGCTSEFYDWMVDTRTYARQSFVYFRGQATKWQEYPSGWERQAAKYRQYLVFKRVEKRQADATDDFLDCVLDGMPMRARLLLS